MKKLEQERAAVIKKIEAVKDATKDSPLGAARAEWQSLKAVKVGILNERKVIFDRRDQIKAQTESLINDAKKAKGDIKYKTIEDIERRMKDLARRQETTSMSLSDEKKLVKEIEELSSSKKVVAQLAGKEDNITNSKLASKDIGGAIAEKNQALKEINAKVRGGDSWSEATARALHRHSFITNPRMSPSTRRFARRSSTPRRSSLIPSTRARTSTAPKSQTSSRRRTSSPRPATRSTVKSGSLGTNLRRPTTSGTATRRSCRPARSSSTRRRRRGGRLRRSRGWQRRRPRSSRKPLTRRR